MGVNEWASWQDRKTRPQEQVRQDLETTLDLKGKPYGMEVRESRLSDTGRIRMGKLFGSKR